jgi:hypothetical protein
LGLQTRQRDCAKEGTHKGDVKKGSSIRHLKHYRESRGYTEKKQQKEMGMVKREDRLGTHNAEGPSGRKRDGTRERNGPVEAAQNRTERGTQ